MRGSEKKIIHVRDTGSRVFEEAYFILRRGIGESDHRVSESEMIQEAAQILRESSAACPHRFRRRRIRAGVWLFLAGAAAGALTIGGGTWLLFIG